MYKKDYRLFISLLLWALVPSVYLLIRMNIVSVSDVSIDILGQMEWFDLIDEVIVTTLTVPLYFLLKKENGSADRNGMAFLISFGIYVAFTVLIAFNVSRIADFMNAGYASQYLLLQSFSMLTGFISTFMILLFTLNEDDKTVKTLLVFKVIMLSFLDFVLIRKYKDIGASYSEIGVNALVAAVSLIVVCRKGYIRFKRFETRWIKQWCRSGLFAGIQIFLDNWIYAIMICRMVNAVSESGNYWVANNFIWGWLLVPVHTVAEIIKKNSLEKLDYRNTWRHGIIIAVMWIITMPGWGPFIRYAMAVESETILAIVIPNIPFYLGYIVSAFIDAWFVSKGKTIYNAGISLYVNVIYYGAVYIGFKNGLFETNMMFIIMMFGFGMVVHMLLSVALYFFERKRSAGTAVLQ